LGHGSTEFIVLRGLPDVSDSDFVYYLTLWDYVRGFAISQMTGTSGRQRVPTNALHNLIIKLPPLPIQRAIAHILGTLDDKIELNRQMNATLEAIARALFKSWFVDFDPVRAKAEGRQPAGMDAETAALFPDAFVDSELGKIPKGWKRGALNKIADITMGQSPPGETYNESGDGVPFYQGVRDFGFRFPSRRVYCTAPTRYAEKGDALLSVRAPVGETNIAIERCSIGRGLAALREKSRPKGYLYYLLKDTKVQWETFEAAGTVFGSASKSDLENLEVLIPTPQVIQAFGQIVEPLDAKIEANERESQTLAALRDALLPKLISGEIRIKDAVRLIPRI
jgi:type I restriction enzyme S subunit